MGKVAIQGHATRGEEVIEILEMLGGKNKYRCFGNNIYCRYYKKNGVIHNTAQVGFNNIKLFTLEEFLEKFPYKVGDKVVYTAGIGFISKITWDNGENEMLYEVKVGNESWLTDAKHLQPYNEETMGDKPNILQQLKDYFDNTPREVIEKEWYEYDKYNDISPKVNEYLEYVNNIRQPKYPKTYEECCKVLNIIPNNKLVFSNPNEESEYAYGNLALCNAFDRLKICRDAYWKIEGAWKPYFGEDFIYAIGTCYDTIEKRMVTGGSGILLFPTEEMRDAFYENFKDLIEECKELL